MPISEERLASHIDDISAAGIAGAVGRLVTSGRLSPGDRLPTVRALAAHLGVSPMTVSAAWKVLAADGLVSTRGRAGTTVLRVEKVPSATRQRALGALNDRLAHDLASGAPDPALLPNLAPALARVSRLPLPSTYQADPVVPELERLLRHRWPFQPESIAVVNGAGDALDRLVGLVVHRGSRIMVEDPTYPPLLDLLEAAGAALLPLAMDEQGILPASLRRALRSEPVALFVQPRAQNPTGASLSTARAREISGLLGRTDVLIIEDDHAGDVAPRAPVSLGRHLPRATVHVASFSKSHGPDLRLAAVGGAATPIDALVDRRYLGPGWSSRLLQHVLVDLLTEPESVAQIERARQTYAARRRATVDALIAHGLHAASADGFNIWVEVADENYAVASLAAAGISVARGSPFMVSRENESHIRLTISQLDKGFTDIAAAVARAARPLSRRTVR